MMCWFGKLVFRVFKKKLVINNIKLWELKFVINYFIEKVLNLEKLKLFLF